MKSKKHQEDARRIIAFFEANNFDRKFTINHFLDEKLVKRTIERVLERYNKTGQIEYSTKSGPPPSALSKNNLKKIKNKFLTRPTLSVRKCANEIKISSSSVVRAKKRLNIKTYNKKTVPKNVKNQQDRSQSKKFINCNRCNTKMLSEYKFCYKCGLQMINEEQVESNV